MPYLVMSASVFVSRPQHFFALVGASILLLLSGGWVVVASCDEIWSAAFLPRPGKRGLSSAMMLALFVAHYQLMFAWFVLFLSLVFRVFTRPKKGADPPARDQTVEFSAPAAYARVPSPSSALAVNNALHPVTRVLFTVGALLALGAGLFLLALRDR
jgi:hypothetical protein